MRNAFTLRKCMNFWENAVRIICTQILWTADWARVSSHRVRISHHIKKGTFFWFEYALFPTSAVQTNASNHNRCNAVTSPKEQQHQPSECHVQNISSIRFPAFLLQFCVADAVKRLIRTFRGRTFCIFVAYISFAACHGLKGPKMRCETMNTSHSQQMPRWWRSVSALVVLPC